MFTQLPRSSRFLLVAQIGLIVGGIATLTFYPAADGPVALVALDGRDAASLAAPLIANGGTLLGRGPLSNMLIVTGPRERITRDLLASGVLVVAAPRSWCGSESPAR